MTDDPVTAVLWAASVGCACAAGYCFGRWFRSACPRAAERWGRFWRGLLGDD